MKAMIYGIKVFGSVLEWTHGAGLKIIELHIPSNEISVNLGADPSDAAFHCFRSNGDRYKSKKECKLIKKIEIDKRVVDMLENHLSLQERCIEEVSSIFKELKS